MRADAQRSVALVLEAAVHALADDPDASMAAIARRAGVTRATVYVHFPTREALVAAVTQRAIAEVVEAIDAAEPERGEASDALERVVAETWRTLGSYHSLVAINTRLPHADLHALHQPVLERLVPLIERGRRAGDFRADVPADWHLSMVMALIHAASGELRSGKLSADDIERALVKSALGAVRESPR